MNIIDFNNKIKFQHLLWRALAMNNWQLHSTEMFAVNLELYCSFWNNSIIVSLKFQRPVTEEALLVRSYKQGWFKSD